MVRDVHEFDVIKNERFNGLLETGGIKGGIYCPRGVDRTTPRGEIQLVNAINSSSLFIDIVQFTLIPPYFIAIDGP